MKIGFALYIGDRQKITLMKRILFILFLLASITAEAQTFDGFALYNRLNNTTSYLIDDQGMISHSWSCALQGNYAVLLKPNGNIVRGARHTSNQINGAAVGGRIQELDPQANVVWEFTYSDANHIQHHDLSLMPNGNVLFTAWDRKTSTELKALGFTGNESYQYSTQIIEIAKDGTAGKIVWQWNMWDHLMQDTDMAKPDFGKIEDHPELMDINVDNGSTRAGDWFHVNGIDYNPVLDQIAFSSRFMSEIFIIDHSTTIAEAATHAGGNSGMGGDFLYRWGNPANYNTVGARNIPGPVHDVRWIEDDGRPNGGYLQFFNNQGSGGNGNSTIDAIKAPENGFNYTRSVGTAFGPTAPNWTHTCRNNASGQSASDRMFNGNTFVNLSGSYMYEVDSNDNLLWQYSANSAKGFRYTCNYPGVLALLGSDPCGRVGVEDIVRDRIKLFPNPSNGIFKVGGIHWETENFRIVVRDLKGRTIIDQLNHIVIDISDQENGIYFVDVLFDEELIKTTKISLAK